MYDKETKPTKESKTQVFGVFTVRKKGEFLEFLESIKKGSKLLAQNLLKLIIQKEIQKLKSETLRRNFGGVLAEFLGCIGLSG